MAQAEPVPAHAAPAEFVTTFRQRFAQLFGRKIGRQRAEQYVGGLLGGKAERRNVTSLADTVDGASARALGWLLNRSPWPTRPVVDALQLYVGNTFGESDGLFTLNLDHFVKRGDNAVGVERQFIHHIGRTSNAQIGVFLAYGTPQNSSLVDAALYMPHSWIDDTARREKAGVPERLQYQTRSELALGLLQEARAGGHLPGQWVTSWHGEGFEADLRERLDADGWRYLLPVSAEARFYPTVDAADLHPYGHLLAAQAGGSQAAGPHAHASFQLVRVWAPLAEAARHPAWLVGATDQLTGDPVAFLSNAPEDEAAEMFARVLAARTETVRMLAARCAGVSLDVYRVRGWDGWQRHVTLALLASAFRACLTDTSAQGEISVPTPVALSGQPLESPAQTLRAPADAASAAPAPVIPPLPEEMAVSIDEPVHPAFDAADAAGERPAVSPPIPAAPSTYRLVVDMSESEWRAVRAFQVWLVADTAGSIISSAPSKAEIEREEVGGRIEVRFQSTQSREQVLEALAEVPEVSLIELVAESEAAPVSVADIETPAALAPVAEAGPFHYDLDIDIHETDWRSVRAFQVWLTVDEAGVVHACSPSKAEIERQEVGPKMLVQLESYRSAEQLLTSLREVPEITVISLTVAGVAPPLMAPAPTATAPAVDETPVELGDTEDLLAALEAELSERSIAREAGLMPAFEGPIEVVGNAVIEANIILEETRELVGAGSGSGSNGTNGHVNGNGAAGVTNLIAPTAPPVAPPAEAPVRPAAAAQASAAPAEAVPLPAASADRARPAEEQMVVLDVGDESYGIPVKQVREIIRVPPITRVPNGPAFLEGVINLRGQVIPVMDLRKHLGIHSSMETRRSRVVVSELGRHTVGLMVDAVSEVVMVSTTDIEPPPAIFSGTNDGQICGVVRLGDRLVLFLDPDRMLPNR